MTVGTGIVVAIAILCATFLATMGIGVYVNNRKYDKAQQLTKEVLSYKDKFK